uniref:C2H2-type domain-containing protein n=1 Tax=Ascaris lumbricoides TaxID=6252 RepID=A0A0M3ILF9_ASCLU
METHGSAIIRREALTENGFNGSQADMDESDLDDRLAERLIQELEQEEGAANVLLETGGTQSFQCEWGFCFGMFDTQANLIDHVLAAHIQPPHCDALLEHIRSLRTDVNVHTQRRLYTCEHINCGKKFKLETECEKHHYRAHLLPRPYQCTISECIKHYAELSSLREHIKKVHGEEVYELWKQERKRNMSRASSTASSTKPSASVEQSLAMISGNESHSGQSGTRSEMHADAVDELQQQGTSDG